MAANNELLQNIHGYLIKIMLHMYFICNVLFQKCIQTNLRNHPLHCSQTPIVEQPKYTVYIFFKWKDILTEFILFHLFQEGEEIPLHMYELDIGYDVGEDRIFFIWPMTIVHKIDERSPLYNMSASDLKDEDFEIVVLLEGVIESTGKLSYNYLTNSTTYSRPLVIDVSILLGL